MKRLFLLVVLSALLFSCKEQEVKFPQSEINADYDAKTVKIEINSNASWDLKADCEDSFLKLTKTSGKKNQTVEALLEQNNTPQKRTCSIEAKTKKGNLGYLTVKQDANPLFGRWESVSTYLGVTCYDYINFNADYTGATEAFCDDGFQDDPNNFTFTLDDDMIYGIEGSTPYTFSDNNTKLILYEGTEDEITFTKVW